MKSLVAFRDDHILIGRTLLCFFAVAFLLTLWDRIREAYRFGKSDAPTERLWMKIINGKEQFLLMAGILTVIYFKAPYYIYSGGAWINDRVHIYIFLVLLPFLSHGGGRPHTPFAQAFPKLGGEKWASPIDLD